MAPEKCFQWVTPGEYRRRTQRVGDPPQSVVASHSGIDPGNFSKWLAGQVGLSERAQQRLNKTIYFFEWVHERANGIPVDFGSVEALKSLRREWVKLERADLVVDVEEEEESA